MTVRTALFLTAALGVPASLLRRASFGDRRRAARQCFQPRNADDAVTELRRLRPASVRAALRQDLVATYINRAYCASESAARRRHRRLHRAIGAIRPSPPGSIAGRSDAHGTRRGHALSKARSALANRPRCLFRPRRRHGPWQHRAVSAIAGERARPELGIARAASFAASGEAAGRRQLAPRSRWEPAAPRA